MSSSRCSKRKRRIKFLPSSSSRSFPERSRLRRRHQLKPVFPSRLPSHPPRVVHAPLLVVLSRRRTGRPKPSNLTSACFQPRRRQNLRKVSHFGHAVLTICKICTRSLSPRLYFPSTIFYTCITTSTYYCPSVLYQYAERRSRRRCRQIFLSHTQTFS